MLVPPLASAIDQSSQAGEVGKSLASWADLTKKQSEGGVTITPVAPGVWKFHVGTPEAQTPLRFHPFVPRKEEMAKISDSVTLPVRLQEIETLIRPSGCVVDIPMTFDERIYGFGMSFREFQYGYRVKTLYSHDGYTLAPAPFYVSSRGYGVYVDTARYAEFQCGNMERKGKDASEAPANLEAHKPAFTPEDLYKTQTVARRSMTIDIPAAQGADVYLFAGPTISDVVRRYNLFSGGGALPPMWGLGIWYRMGPVNQQEAIDLSGEIRKDQLPITVIGLEPHWQKQTYSCSYAWNQGAFPNPQKFVETLSSSHFQTNLWLQGFIHPTSEIYQQLFPLSGSDLVWRGLVPDFTLPEARKIWGGFLDDHFIKKGISGFKVDECESQYMNPQPFTFPESSSFPSGMDGEQMHSLFGRLMQDVLMDRFHQENRRTYSLIRNSTGLAAPLPFVLYSDSYSPAEYVRAMLGAAFSGQSFAPEVRDAKSLNDFLRRIELAVFSPMVLMNGWQVKMPYWDQINIDLNNQGQVMPERDKVTAACRELFNLRMALVPYLYSAFDEYRENGIPPLRPLVMDWPEDASVYALDDEFMVGPSLLVAPILSDSNQRKVYLPAGDWYDFWTNQKFTGGQDYLIEKPVGQIPVFVRDNSLLPIARPVQWIDAQVPFEMTVRVYGDQPKPFTLVEDDGVSFDYEKGAQNKLTLTWTPGAQGRADRAGGFQGTRYKIGAWEKQRPY